MEGKLAFCNTVTYIHDRIHSQMRSRCRYIDDVFMTSNMSVDELRAKLDWMNGKDREHIQITCTVGFSAEFLDVHIENRHGQLHTSVFHKPAAEPYVLPYASDHPRHVHMSIPYEALLRAVRLCSDVHTFDNERLYIEVMLLINGYPPRFLRRHFDRFFRLNQADQVLTKLDAQQYGKLHEKLLHLPTQRERARRQRTAVDDHDTRMHHRQIESERKAWNKSILIVPYTYESGPITNFKNEFRKLWTKFYAYKTSVVKNVRLMITTFSNPSLNDLLVRKKPPRSLLTAMPASKTVAEQEEDEEDVSVG